MGDKDTNTYEMATVTLDEIVGEGQTYCSKSAKEIAEVILNRSDQGKIPVRFVLPQNPFVLEMWSRCGYGVQIPEELEEKGYAVSTEQHEQGGLVYHLTCVSPLYLDK
ncbi:hypothetical protein KY320_03340 [Candidatus Woesearchaeota archaeon]|nr:hypothetical protein [Candidatus Woesearchaeota archaeon]